MAATVLFCGDLARDLEGTRTSLALQLPRPAQRRNLYTMPSRQPYRGLSRKLVLAFDVGTTYSGISYCILDPGEVPKVLGVSR